MNPIRLIRFSLLCFLTACVSCADEPQIDSSESFSSNAATSYAASSSPFDSYLETDFPAADGFDFPVGDRNGDGTYKDRATGREHSGWYVAAQFAEEYELGIHPGEDWNGRGGGATDLGQPVHAIATGRVRTAKNFGRLWGNVIVIEHLVYENHGKRTIHSVYAHLNSIAVKEGDLVKRRGRIGTIGSDPEKLYSPHLHLEIRTDTTLPPTYWPSSHGKDVDWVREHYLEPISFIRNRRKLFVPQKERRLILIDQARYLMRFYEKGKLHGEYDVSFGQAKGRKRVEGDKRSPKGMYFIVEREEGEKITGPTAPYMGGYWLKLNYPNAYDAMWGRAEGHISESEATRISSAWTARKPTPQKTALGGGIGLHGWIKEWENDATRHRSWGCIVMHNHDIPTIYDRIPMGTMVVIW